MDWRKCGQGIAYCWQVSILFYLISESYAKELKADVGLTRAGGLRIQGQTFEGHL